MLSYGPRLMGAGNRSKCLNTYLKMLKNMLKKCIFYGICFLAYFTAPA